jgi:hypothetical protein
MSNPFDEFDHHGGTAVVEFVPPKPDDIVPEQPYTQGVATTFGYQDPQDGGTGAWGDNTNNADVVGVSLPRDVLRAHFGHEDAAHGAQVEVVNPATGAKLLAPIVDKGPSAEVERRDGNVIDLTHKANELLGGDGKTPMQWRILAAPAGQQQPDSQQSSAEQRLQEIDDEHRYVQDSLMTGLHVDEHPVADGTTRQQLVDLALAKADVNPGNYETLLTPTNRAKYLAWKGQVAPRDSGGDYDLPGAFLTGFWPDPMSGHWDDRFKKPNEPTFSNMSQYYKDRPDLAGTWNGDTFVPPPAQPLNNTERPAFVPPRPQDIIDDGSGPQGGGGGGGVIQAPPAAAAEPAQPVAAAPSPAPAPAAPPVPLLPAGPSPTPFLPPSPQDIVDDGSGAPSPIPAPTPDPNAAPQIPALANAPTLSPEAKADLARGGARKVGFFEALGRQAGDALLSVPEFVNQGLGIFPYLEDAAVQAVTGKSPQIYEHWYENMIAPSEWWRNHLQLQQNEQYTTPGMVGASMGSLPRDVPLALATGGSGLLEESGATVMADAAPTITNAMKSIAPHLARAAAMFAPTAAIEGSDAAKRAASRGGDVVDQAVAGIATAALVDAASVLPMGAPSAARSVMGRVAERAGTGAAMAIPTNVVVQHAQAIIEHRSDLSPGWKQAILGAIPMAAMNALVGGRVLEPMTVNENAAAAGAEGAGGAAEGAGGATGGHRTDGTDRTNVAAAAGAAEGAGGFDATHPDAAYMPDKPAGWTPPPSDAGGAPGEAYTREAATLPRAVEWLRPETKGNPSPTKIRQYLRKALDVPIRAGMRVSKGAMAALGVYRIRPETIRMRALNDIPTLLHEVGHYLHHMIFPEAGNRGRAMDFGGAYDHELMPMGAATSAPGYTPAMVRMEGVAEWFRTWVSDPAAARALAPMFTKHFEETIHRDYPEMERILGEVQKQVAAYISQPSKVKAEEMIQWDDRADDKPTLTDKLREWYTAWVHELAPIERAMKELESFGLPHAEARRVAELANNFKGGWRSKAEYDLEHHQTNLDGNVVGPGLKQILTKLTGHDLREFSMYAALKRAEEKRAQGIRTGFEPVMAGKDYPELMRGWAKKYEARRQELVKYTENQMRMLEQAGFFTPEQLAAMRDANRDYVPFYRIVESLNGASAKRGTGKGFVNTFSGVRGMKGSDLMIADPLQSVIKNTMMFRELAERNRVGREFVDAVRKVQGGGRIGETILKPMKPVQVSHEEVLQALQQAGINTASLKTAGLDLGFTLFRASEGINGRKGVFRVWKGGKELLFQVEDRELLRALTMMDSVDAEVFSKFPALKIMSKATGLLRAGATLAPEFLIRHPLRHQMITGVYSEHGYMPFLDLARGAFSMVRKDHWYQDWVKSGGKYGGLYSMEVRNPREALEQVTRGNRTAVEQALHLMNPMTVIHALRYASEVMDAGTRIGEFRRAKLAGKSDVEAANASRDASLDFARAGYKGQVANKLIAFFNVMIQDLDKMRRSFTERPASTTMRAVAMITVPSLLCWWLGKDDERIEGLPEWRKGFFWNIDMKPFGADFILSVPKPFLLGTIFGTSVERASDYIYKRDKNALNKWWGDVLENTLVHGDLGVAAMVKPLVEDMTNYSFFKNGPLQNDAEMSLSPGLRANADTSVTARWLGEKLNVSPILIDNTVRGYLGGLGRYGTSAVDWALTHAHLVDVPPAPATDWRSLPGIKGLVVGPNEPSAWVTRYYRAMDLAEQRLRDFKEYGQQLRTGDQADFWRKNRAELSWYAAQAGGASMIEQLRRVRQQLTELNKAQAWVLNTRGLSPEQKAERLREIQIQRNTLSKNAFEHGFHPTDRNAAY